MLFASNRGAGMNIGFPDICLTPAAPAPIPTPYPNFAMNAMAAPFAVTVWISMMNALNLISEIPMTEGDEPGTASPNMGPGRYTMGNPIVYVELMPGINLLCPTTGNDMVNPIGAVLVPSIVNVFFTDREGEAAAGRPALAPSDVEGLARALEDPAPVARGVLVDGATAVVAIARFTLETPTLLHEEIVRLTRAGMKALVLDLRGCPGGDLDAAVRLADDFLDRGCEIVTRIDGDGDETVYRARGGAPYAFPLALLVDAGTASAAEIFAGALQAHARAVVAGERTHGKGTAQRLVPGFAEPGARYATVAAFTRPGGEPIDGRGVVPDVEVDPTGALDAARAAIASLLSPTEVR
jgi:carboxyl-terminal processing protease